MVQKQENKIKLVAIVTTQDGLISKKEVFIPEVDFRTKNPEEIKNRVKEKINQEDNSIVWFVFRDCEIGSVDSESSIVELNPDVRFGKPTIKNTRIAVEDIIGMLASGMNIDEISEELNLSKVIIESVLWYMLRKIEG